MTRIPAFLHAAPDLDAMLAQADACLLIGDKGMLADGSGPERRGLRPRLAALDRPAVRLCGLARQARKTSRRILVDALATAKAWGLTQIDAIAAEEAVRIGTTVRQCRHYLTEVMDYDFGEEHQEALALFGAKAYAQQLLPHAPAPVLIA